MSHFFFEDEGHTLCSALRVELERQCNHDDMVSCGVMHPLDKFVRVSIQAKDPDHLVRASLLAVKETIRDVRVRVLSDQK